MIRIVSFAIFLALALPAAAQISEPNAESAYGNGREGDQPNIPGTFTLELGLNSALDADANSTAANSAGMANVSNSTNAVASNTVGNAQ